MSGNIDFAGLYPFLYTPLMGQAPSQTALLDSVRQSTLAKCAEVVSLRAELIAEYSDLLSRAAEAMALRFDAGGKLLAFGNGGSATDADDAAADCVAPPRDDWRPLPALSLSSDSATVTALANDVGLANIFSRQLSALGERGDIALGFSTSGNSTNVVSAFREARRRGLLTIAMSGYDGGELSRSGDVDFCFIARREFVPRVQEGHATLWHSLLMLVQLALADRPSVR